MYAHRKIGNLFFRIILDFNFTATFSKSPSTRVKKLQKFYSWDYIHLILLWKWGKSKWRKILDCLVFLAGRKMWQVIWKLEKIVFLLFLNFPLVSFISVLFHFPASSIVHCSTDTLPGKPRIYERKSGELFIIFTKKSFFLIKYVIILLFNF